MANQCFLSREGHGGSDNPKIGRCLQATKS